MKAMFFGVTNYSTIVGKAKDLFVSGAQDAKKPELPIGLVALSAVAIHAILQDYALGHKEDFPAKELEGVWKTYIGILRNIEKVNVGRYHRLMHNLYAQSSGALALATHGMSNDDIFNAVDCSAMAQDNDVRAVPVIVKGTGDDTTAVVSSTRVPAA
ncbi:hypothetical protein D9758_018334 [Tetrapyrgos nigripes]|uniref:DUF6532 domain-containing protein n=1 Tax=Tetrapyrgos nigripes TaxID=182062 RepID=A0A8H5C624_9AGAR|nr:hypothetical protein D9758_018334 [Tetrapyrgos nigripes]